MSEAVLSVPRRGSWRGTLAWRVILSVVLSFAVTGVLILMAGKNPFVAYQHIALGAFGSWPRIVVGLNKAAAHPEFPRPPPQPSRRPQDLPSPGRGRRRWQGSPPRAASR